MNVIRKVLCRSRMSDTTGSVLGDRGDSTTMPPTGGIDPPVGVTSSALGNAFETLHRHRLTHPHMGCIRWGIATSCMPGQKGAIKMATTRVTRSTKRSSVPVRVKSGNTTKTVRVPVTTKTEVRITKR